MRDASDDPAVALFLEAVIEVCRQHGMSLGHEDTHGAFLIHGYHEKFDNWLRDALDARSLEGIPDHG